MGQSDLLFIMRTELISKNIYILVVHIGNNNIECSYKFVLRVGFLFIHFISLKDHKIVKDNT